MKQQYKVVAFTEKVKDLIDATSCKERIYDGSRKIEDEMEDLHANLCDITKKNEEETVEDYKNKMLKAQKEYKEFIENNNEQELIKRLEQNRNDILNERAALLQYTININIDMKSLRDKAKKYEQESKELDEEIKFLQQQIDFADEQHEKLEDKIDKLREEQNTIDPSLEVLNEASQLKIQPHATKLEDTNSQSVLDIKTHSKFKFRISRDGNMNKLRSNKMLPKGDQGSGHNKSRLPDNSNRNSMFVTDKRYHSEEVLEADERAYNNLANILNFVTENKYVVEAIFENVMFECQKNYHSLSDLTEAEKKMLMEKQLLNEEFKEYIYQKISNNPDTQLDDIQNKINSNAGTN